MILAVGAKCHYSVLLVVSRLILIISEVNVDIPDSLLSHFTVEYLGHANRPLPPFSLRERGGVGGAWAMLSCPHVPVSPPTLPVIGWRLQALKPCLRAGASSASAERTETVLRTARARPED